MGPLIRLCLDPLLRPALKYRRQHAHAGARALSWILLFMWPRRRATLNAFSLAGGVRGDGCSPRPSVSPSSSSRRWSSTRPDCRCAPLPGRSRLGSPSFPLASSSGAGPRCPRARCSRFSPSSCFRSSDRWRCGGSTSLAELRQRRLRQLLPRRGALQGLRVLRVPRWTISPARHRALLLVMHVPGLMRFGSELTLAWCRPSAA